MTMRGRKALIKRLRQIPPKTVKAAKVALEKSADDIVRTQQRFAPLDDGVLLGTIRRGPVGEVGPNLSVLIEAGGEATTRPVRSGQSATYDYAAAVEFGTIETPAKPFFFVGYRQRKKSARARIKRAIRKSLREA